MISKNHGVLLGGVMLFLGVTLLGQSISDQSRYAGAALVQYTHPVVQPKAADATRLSDVAKNEVAFVPKGDGGVHYRGEFPGSERLPQGPAALAVDGSGGFWLLDTVGGQILHLAANGSVIANLDKSGDLVHGAALALAQSAGSSETRLAVLDLGTTMPRVFQYDEGGRFISVTNLPPAWTESAQGLTLNSDGSFDVFVVAGDTGRYRVSSRNGRVSYVRVPGLGIWGPVEGPAFERPGRRIRPVDPDNRVMEKQLLGVTSTGDQFIRVGEFSGDSDGNMYVDVTVQRFSPSGIFTGIARVPTRDRYVPVESNDGVAVDPFTGLVYVLVPEADGASIRLLNFVQQLEPTTPIMRPISIGAARSVQAAASPPLRSTASMIAVTNDYCSSKVVVPASAVPNDATTTGRTAPSYMSTAGGSYYVPYTYGGFDNRANFASHMMAATLTNHFKAGDVDGSQQFFSNGPGVSDWLRSGKPWFGVDCSGFVSRAWGLTFKESTSTLLNYVLPQSLATFQQGDIMLSASHVRMYIDLTTSPTNTGYYRYEESSGAPYGVAIKVYRLSDQIQQRFVHYRYVNVGATTPSSTVASCIY